MNMYEEYKGHISTIVNGIAKGLTAEAGPFSGGLLDSVLLQIKNKN